MKLFIDKIDKILEKFYLSEKKYEVTNSEIKRIKNIIEKIEKKQELLNDKIDKNEKLLESLEIKNSQSQSLWSTAADYALKIIWIIVVSFILYKLGINTQIEIPG